MPFRKKKDLYSNFTDFRLNRSFFIYLSITTMDRRMESRTDGYRVASTQLKITFPLNWCISDAVLRYSNTIFMLMRDTIALPKYFFFIVICFFFIHFPFLSPQIWETNLYLSWIHNPYFIFRTYSKWEFVPLF